MKIGPIRISLEQPRERIIPAATIDAEYEALRSSGKRLVLGVFPARSGARWLCDIFSAHGNAVGSLERFAVAESMWRYIHFYNLPIDTAGIIATIKAGIVADWKKHDISLVFSPYFSHGLLELDFALHPDTVILAVNDPRRTVQSLYNKDFFSERYIRADATKAIGYQPEIEKMHWLFGRIVPSGEEYAAWERLTRVGKISMWGETLMTDIEAQFRQLPEGRRYVFDLMQADQNYAYYQQLADRFGLLPRLAEQAFLNLKGKTVKASDNAPHAWSDLEELEFGEHTKTWHRIYSQLAERHA